jgi:muconolactone delta-isomerase
VHGREPRRYPHSKEVRIVRYLVIGTAVNVGVAIPPQQVAQMLDTVIAPSLEMLAKWEREGRIHGATFAGQRANCMIIDAASHEELSDLLTTLPFWGLLDWKITPLASYEGMAKRVREMSQRLKSVGQR